jgi:hypothetical protein
MRENTTFTHPIELSDNELDLVAAGGGGGGGCGCDGGRSGNEQAGLINLTNVLNDNNVNVSLFSNVFQA